MTYEADFALKVAIQTSERASIEFFNNIRRQQPLRASINISL